MKDNWLSRNIWLLFLLVVIAMSVVQYGFTQQRLQSFREYADQNYETLLERMRQDDVPHNIRQHIIYAHNESTFNTGLLVRSLSTMQIYAQLNILLFLIFGYYLTKTRKAKEEGSALSR